MGDCFFSPRYAHINLPAFHNSGTWAFGAVKDISSFLPILNKKERRLKGGRAWTISSSLRGLRASVLWTVFMISQSRKEKAEGLDMLWHVRKQRSITPADEEQANGFSGKQTEARRVEFWGFFLHSFFFLLSQLIFCPGHSIGHWEQFCFDSCVKQDVHLGALSHTRS